MELISKPNVTLVEMMRDLRNFISLAIDLRPGEAHDLLANNAEDLIYRAELVMGKEAFGAGDRVIVQSSSPMTDGEFEATVVSVTEVDGEPLFTVQSDEDGFFNARIGDLRYDHDNTCKK